MSDLRLNGINPLSYLGVNPYTPAPLFLQRRNPTQNDNQNFTLGTFWLNTLTYELWYLADLALGVATWILLSNGGGTVTDFVTDDANTVTPAGGIVNVFGGNNIATTGSGNTITIDTAFQSGSFTPVLSFGGDSTGITYDQQVGNYTRVGNLVFIVIYIVLSSKGTGVGNNLITGLPFPVSMGVDTLCSPGFLTLPPGTTWTWANFVGTALQIDAGGTGINSIILTDAEFANNSNFTLQGFYTTS